MPKGRAAGGSTEGKVRKTNEDAYRIYYDEPAIIDKGRGFLFAVADGIGSYRAGAQAAWMAVDQLALYFRMPASQFSDSTLQDLVFRANEVITNLRTQQKGYYGMGCTLTLLHIDPDFTRARVYQAGDSMAYVVRDGRLATITTPHVSSDSELTNHMGLGDKFRLEKVAFPLKSGDSLLLCSDGLSGFVAEDQLLEGLLVSASPQHCLDHLMVKALEASDDNVTGIVVKVDH